MSSAHAVATKNTNNKVAASSINKITRAVISAIPENKAGFSDGQFLIQRKEKACSCGGGCPRCQAKRQGQKYERLQSRHVQDRDTGQTEAPTINPEELTAPGQPLDPATRGSMERRFSHNFAHVRIHADADAASAASNQNARAFTVDHNIYFGADREPSPTSESLLAHELTHVVQADLASVNPAQSASSVEVLEGEARQVAGAFHSGIAIPTIRGLARGLTAPLRQGLDDLEGPTFGNLPRDEPVSGFRLKLEQIKGKWYEILPGREQNKRRAAGWYDFVVQGDEIWAEKVKSPLGHTEAARGGRVKYAGQIKFTSHSGKITVWNNGSGHFRPAGSFAKNAGLPLDKFKLHPDRMGIVQLPVFQPNVSPPTKASSPHAPPSKVPPAKPVHVKYPPLTTSPSTTSPSKGSAAPKASKASRSLGAVTKWGKVSPLDGAMLYLDLHAAHFVALEKVSNSAAIANDLLNRIESLERGAREMRRAVNNQRVAEGQLPGYPLQLGDVASQISVSATERAFVEKYFHGAVRIANDALSAATKIHRAIEGWDAVKDQANKTGDFTRKAIWEAIIKLDMRFSSKSGNFRAYLVETRRRALNVEDSAREKQYLAADILDKPRPAYYQPPSYTP